MQRAGWRLATQHPPAGAIKGGSAMIVVSTGIVAALYLPGENTTTAEARAPRVIPPGVVDALANVISALYYGAAALGSGNSATCRRDARGGGEIVSQSRISRPGERGHAVRFPVAMLRFHGAILRIGQGSGSHPNFAEIFSAVGNIRSRDAWPRHLALTPPEERNAESLLPAVAHVSPRTSRTTTSRPHKQMFRKE